MKVIRCDQCKRDVETRSAGWTTITTRRLDTPLEVDLCSPGCHRLWLDEEHPARRPAFGATRALLREHADADDLDQRVDAGEYEVVAQ